MFESQERSSERVVSTQCGVQHPSVRTGLRHGPSAFLWNFLFQSFFFPSLPCHLFVLSASRSFPLIPLPVFNPLSVKCQISASFHSFSVFFFFSPPAADLRHSVHMPASLTLTSLSNSKQKNNKKKKTKHFFGSALFYSGGRGEWKMDSESYDFMEERGHKCYECCHPSDCGAFTCLMGLGWRLVCPRRDTPNPRLHTGHDRNRES